MGKCVAKQLAAKGANLIIVSRNVAKLEAALAEIKVAGYAQVVDVSNSFRPQRRTPLHNDSTI
jgi:short-subunit dehydrogenase